MDVLEATELFNREHDKVAKLKEQINRLHAELAKKDELIFAYDATRSPVIDKTIIDLRAKLVKQRICPCCGYSGDNPIYTCNKNKCEIVFKLQAELDNYKYNWDALAKDALDFETKNTHLQAENKKLLERIELAVDYLPECYDKAKSFLIPALKDKELKNE